MDTDSGVLPPSPHSAPAGDTPGVGRSVLTSLGILAGIAVLGLLLASVLLPVILNATQKSRVTSCANNLAQLWKMQEIYISQYSGGPAKARPPQTGFAFWLHLRKPPKPLLEDANVDILLCPILGTGQLGDVQYYGPGKQADLLGDLEPMGSDDMHGELNGLGEPNHGTYGGCLLGKSGGVIEISLDDWKDLTESIGGGTPMTRPIP